MAIRSPRRRSTPFSAPVVALLLVVGWLAAPAAQAQLIQLRQLSIAPDSATAGGSIAVGGDRLRAGGTYTVVLVSGRDRHTLATVSNGDGSFQQQARVPAVAVGSYPVELLVDGSVVDSRELRVVAPLAVTVTNASPAAGSTVGFSVGGLAEGSLSLVYEGKVVFGPANTAGGTLSGKVVLPTDRPARLPAFVVLEARNAVGRLVPRVGNRTLSVQLADTRPFARISTATLSTTAPTARQRFGYTGSVATNEMQATAVEVEYFWQAADGSVQPMGAPLGAVQADGSFSYTMRTPQLGTMSAGQSSGSGRVIAVTRTTDPNGLVQQQSSLLDSLLTGPDTDGAIDLNLTLTGSDGLPLVGARVDLVEAPLEDLYDSNDNTTGFFLDGTQAAGFATQFGAQASDEVLGCPANLERQYTDASGKVEFEFDLGLPQGGVNVDGSGPPPQVTIEPSEDCVPGGSINTPSFCREVDPAGIKFSAVIRAAFLGYGYTVTNTLPTGSTVTREVPIRLDLRIDRYTGAIDMDTCIPQTPPPCASCGVAYSCTTQTFQRSANRSLVLPKLAIQGLALGDPYFTNSVGHKLTFTSQAGTDPVKFDKVYDLTPLRDSATFQPTTPESWTVEFQYSAGAGRGLRGDAQAPTLHLPRPSGGEFVVPFVLAGGAATCDGEGGAQVWRGTLPTELARAFRFPGEVFGSTGWPKLIKGYLRATDLDDRTGRRDVWLRFERLETSLAALAGTAGVRIETARPHARRISVEPAVDTADTEGQAVPEYNVAKQTNTVDGSAAYQLCVPQSANCGAFSSTEFAHAQFSRSPAAQPPGGHISGADTTTTGTGTAANRWVTLFDKTIPIFRWYWGIPELLSAEVFADLVLRAEYMLEMIFNASSPGSSSASAGGRLEIGIFIGVDIDVLFGILVDAGAAIYGSASSQLVTTTSIDEGASVEECFTFRMDFSGWLEIGCPIANPFDPTCYIPDIEETYNIIKEQIGSGCSSGKQARGLLASHPSPDSLLPGVLAGTPLTLPKTHPSAPPFAPLPAGTREALNRHPAIAIDGNGTRLVLSLEVVDRRMRLVSRVGLLRGFGTPVVISEGYGIRDTAVTFFGTDQAVAVWAESALREGDQRIAWPHEAARHQRLRYAVWNGRVWTSPLDLTTAGFGDGQVRLARCKPSLLAVRSDCTTRKATVVFQRNLDRTIGGSKGIYAADFDGVGFSPIARVDQTGSYNITPALAYQGGKPVVAWVRHDPGSTLDDVGNRRLALRRLDGSSAEELDLGLPTRIAQPTLAAVSDGQLAIGFTRAAATDAFIGTRQAMHLGRRSCTTGCRFSSWRVQDQHGRALYGERPTLAINAAGEAVLTFRGLAYGGVPGASSPEDNIFPGDAPGMRATTGELLQLRSPLSNVPVPVHALSNDGGWHARPTAALDPSSGEVVALSISVPAVRQFVAKHHGAAAAPKLLASTKAVGDGLHLASLPDLPDLAVDRFESTATRLTPGTPIAVTVEVLNRGSAWAASDTRRASLRLWWDTPQTRTTSAGEWAINDLVAAGRQSFAVSVPVPATFGSDERQALRAEIVIEGGDGELDGDNNLATLAIGGMPVPDGLLAVSELGTRFVNLAWSNPADDRVAGYRVYADDVDGRPQPIGSSFNLGFADLAAQFGRSRTYRVSSYSARGIESELSAPVTAAPASAPKAIGIFSDGFE